MSINKLALLRYKTIDSCLRNRQRKWTLENLISKVSDVLYEQEGVGSAVGKRTIQADIQLMRSDKLGYNAPIIVKEKKYYAYSDPAYSITNSPVNKADVDKMKEIVGVLKQLNGFSYFDEMSDLITRLENNVFRSDNEGKDCIQLEGNQLVKGMEHIIPLYQAVLNKHALLLTYQSFIAESARQSIYFPYLLKEYRNRWFLVCREKKQGKLYTLPLDRIIEFSVDHKEHFVPWTGVAFDRHFGDVIGVTKNERDRGKKVSLFVDKKNAPYVLTKPLHSSQRLIKEGENGIVIRIDVVLNFELEREILGFGESMKVLAPSILVERIRRRTALADAQYQTGG